MFVDYLMYLNILQSSSCRFYCLIWDQVNLLPIQEVSLGLLGYEIYFLKEAHQRADKVKLVN